jgi:hypothetical protein
MNGEWRQLLLSVWNLDGMNGMMNDDVCNNYGKYVLVRHVVYLTDG